MRGVLAASITVIFLCSPLRLFSETRFSYNELQQAIIDGNLPLVEQRFDEGLDPEGLNLDVYDYFNNHSLFELALEDIRVTIVELFLERGKDPNILSEFGAEKTPLYVACEVNSDALIKLLLSHGADILKVPESSNPDHQSDVGELLGLAIHEHNNRYLRLCLDSGISPDGRYLSLEREPLINLAIESYNMEAMKMLLDHDADITVVNMYNHYKTTLALAVDAWGMASEGVKLLLQKGADKIHYIYDQPYTGHSTTDRLRVRRTSDLGAQVLGFLNKDEQVQMLEVSPYSQEIDRMNYPWIRIKANRIQGWVFGGYIEPTINSPGLD